MAVDGLGMADQLVIESAALWRGKACLRSKGWFTGGGWVAGEQIRPC